MSSDLKEDENRLKEVEGIGAVLRKGYEDHNAMEKKFDDIDSKQKKGKEDKDDEDSEDEEDDKIIKK